MPDALYLSIWLDKKPKRGANETPINPLTVLERLTLAFPVSKLAHAASTLRIMAVSFSEPPVAEHEVGTLAHPELVSDLASEFYNPDSAFQLDTFWDLWSLESDWRLAPCRVSLQVFAEEFDRPDGEDLRIEFGPDSQFLPDPANPSSTRLIQSNIRSLLHLVEELEKALPVAKKLLWSESGETFAEQLQKALQPQQTTERLN